MRKAESAVAITGAGQSEVGRKLNRSSLDLTCEAVSRAVADAGLRMEDIDGLCTYPGATGMPGLGGPASSDVQDALGLQLTWHSGAAEGPGQLLAVMNAILAVAGGMARHAVVYRTVTEATVQGNAKRGAVKLTGRSSTGPEVTSGPFQWVMPPGAYSPVNWLALSATRYQHTYGLRREDLGGIAVAARAHAARNPAAVFRQPLTMADYLAGRMISTPLSLYDCDVPCDGSVAIVVSAREAAADTRPVPVFVEAMGAAVTDRPQWFHRGDLATMALHDVGTSLWARTDLKPSDVDTAQLYDGFSFLTLLWVEALGFCGPGEGAAFLDGGRTMALDGSLPMNTSGGQLSAGRLHGYGHLYEAVLQARGDAGARQVTGAEVVLTSAGGGPFAGALLLTRGHR
ncbi:thiolase family protein [Sporichthya polymorpha]|uniref:thiolase family protein n=1 Tax=Sporichthya polymorpha TaxID=35751 RepID=UPI00036F34CA|nr:thiolase family protein [Sporichthya polymorpha]